MKKHSFNILAVMLSLVASDAYAADEKSQYDLFNPTPANMLRDMATDRPDQTEGPFTIDAGHFQIETDIVKYTDNRYKQGADNTRSKAWNVAPTTLKAGLTDSTDFHLIFDGYAQQTSSDKVAGTRETKNGLGDVTLRVKHNFWGNEGGQTALGIIPYVKLPTNQDNLGNNDVEGGLILPFSIDFGDGYGLGLMTQVETLKDADDNGYHASFANSASFAVDWDESLGSYYEIYTSKGTDAGDRWVVAFDTGVTYGLTDDIQLDAGINIGLTEAADDYQPFVGVSYRY